MQAEIITIGDELLIGQITDTNSKWIAQELNKIGVSVHEITSIQDSKEHIIKTLDKVDKTVKLIIITGGLGPTNDDLTKLTLTEYCNDKLIHYPEIETHIKFLFDKIKYRHTAADLEQASLPEKATIFKNKQGTASGMWFEHNQKIIISLPGVPNEMKDLMKNSVLPKLQNDFKLPFIEHKTIRIYGVGESNLAHKLEQFEAQLPKNITLAYLPSYGITRLRLSGKNTNKKELESLFKQQFNLLKNKLKGLKIGYEKLEIHKIIQQKCIATKKTLAVAESCTGGNISKIITSNPGSSAYYLGGIISYHKDIKEQILHISNKTITNHSVVSEQVAKEMAKNVRTLLKSDYGIATTGNAGPTTDKTDETVGVVFIAIASDKKTIVKKFNFGQSREKVIQKASIKAFEMFLDFI